MCPVGLPAGSAVKYSPANAGDTSSIPGSGRFPGGSKWQPTPVVSLGESLWTGEPGRL